jgi:hypothetical protein
MLLFGSVVGLRRQERITFLSRPIQTLQKSFGLRKFATDSHEMLGPPERRRR